MGISGAHLSGASDLLPVFGTLAGSVSDASGIPQLGASIQLFDRSSHLVRKTVSAVDGGFSFPNLLAGRYTIKVDQASFLPAERSNLRVEAGVKSVLDIHLATLFSSIEVAYRVPSAGMNDDWKWVLRSSSATRPITRLRPESDGEPGREARVARLFHDTRGVVAVSAGDSVAFAPDVGISGWGSSFGVSTTLAGSNQVQVYGALGENFRTGTPVFGLRAVYSHLPGNALVSANSPEVTVTMRQLSRPAHTPGEGGAQGDTPALRTLALDVYDHVEPFSGMRVEYGASAQSFSYADHVARVSPFVRASYEAKPGLVVSATFSDGLPPTALYIHDGNQERELAKSAATVESLPPLSLRGGHLRVERTKNIELGALRRAGQRTYAIAGFYEAVSDGRVNVTGDLGLLPAADLIDDLATETSIYNLHRYNRAGVVASVTQRVGSAVDVGLTAGRIDGFAVASRAADPEPDVRALLNHRPRTMAAASVRTSIPQVGTQVGAGYEWVQGNTLAPAHVFTTVPLASRPGLFFSIRQPVPTALGLPGRFELCADLQNALAQGYLPAVTGSGRKLLFVQAPRTFRGGLSFTF